MLDSLSQNLCCRKDTTAQVCREVILDHILSEREKVEWAVLDTYDWFNPKYDKPQTWRAVERTVRDMGFIYERSPHARRGLHCRRSLATQVRT